MFIVVKKNDVFKAVIVAIITVFLVAMTAVGGVAPVYLAAEKRLVPVYSVETDEKVVALTFDAAWGADKTRGIIDLLKKYDADGTFFLVGFWIDKYPEETKFIAESGLEIGNHSNNHLHMSKISKDEISKEIDSVNERIKNLTGKTPTYFRPPFGEYDNKLLSVVNEKNMVGVQWSIDSLDWKDRGTEDIIKQCTYRVDNGDIVLFHNDSNDIVNALPTVIKHYQGLGYTILPVSELLLDGEYTIDVQGKQHPKAT